MNTYLIINPAAGRGKAKQEATAVKAFLEAYVPRLHVLETRYQGEAKSFSATLPEDALILSLGGDGTLNEIAHSCAHTRRTIGILPAGSGDDFAKALGIHNLETGLDLVKNFVEGNAKARAVDSGMVITDSQKQRFVNTVGIGFDAEVGAQMLKLPHYLKGKAAYLCALGIQLFSLRAVACEVSCDGMPFYGGRSLFVSNQNGIRTGGSFYLTPQADVADGLLDVMLAGQVGVLQAMLLVPQTLSGKLIHHPQVFRARAKEVRISFAEPRLAHTEGELLAPSRGFLVGLEPHSLNVLSP